MARRIRVPLSFLFAVVCLWLARPTWESIAAGAILMVFGLLLRGRAAGHVQKDKVLTVTGPYAHTRNPLYLGSIILGLGFAAAARDLWIAAGMLLLFFSIYWPLIRAEEEYLRATFPGFEEYARVVPRMLPRFSAAKLIAQAEGDGFSRQRYLKVREYNAIIGALLMLVALAAKILFPWSVRVTP